jgi:hypothetical protein
VQSHCGIPGIFARCGHKTILNLVRTVALLIEETMEPSLFNVATLPKAMRNGGDLAELVK